MNPLTRTLARHRKVIERLESTKPFCPVTLAEYRDEYKALVDAIALTELQAVVDDATGACA